MRLVWLAGVTVVPYMHDKGLGMGGARVGEDLREVSAYDGGSGDADRGGGEHGDLDVE